MNMNATTLLIEHVPMLLSVLLALLCVIYIAVVSYCFLQMRMLHKSDQSCLLRKFHRYCTSLPRNESLPVSAVERILEAIESGNTDVEINNIVIEEIFKTQKR